MLKRRYLMISLLVIYCCFLVSLARAIAEEQPSIDYSSPIIQAVLKRRNAIKENNYHELWNMDYKRSSSQKITKLMLDKSSAEIKIRVNAPIESVEIIAQNRAWVKLDCPSLPLDQQGYYLIKGEEGWKFGNLPGSLRKVERELRSLRKAVMDYFRDKEALPKNLDDLIPAYLKNVPADPFNDDNKEYGYLLDKGWFRLYSIGPDSRDDLGLIEYNQKNGLFSKGDIIAKAVPEKAKEIPGSS